MALVPFSRQRILRGFIITSQSPLGWVTKAYAYSKNRLHAVDCMATHLAVDNVLLLLIDDDGLFSDEDNGR